MAALRAMVLDARQRPAPTGTRPTALQRWRAPRRQQNTVAAYSFDTINQVFSNDEMHLTLARGLALAAPAGRPWSICYGDARPASASR